MRKLQEMRHFFDDEGGIFKELKARHRIIMLTKLCALALTLIGIYGLWALGRQPFVEQRQEIIAMSVMSIIAGLVFNLYTVNTMRQLKQAGILKQFDSQDMLIYCLLDDDQIKSIMVEPDRKKVKLIGEGITIKLRLEEYEIIGVGEYATQINLDSKQIILGMGA